LSSSTNVDGIFTEGFRSYYKTHMLVPQYSPTVGFSKLLQSPRGEAGADRTTTTDAAAGAAAVAPAVSLTGRNAQRQSGKQAVLDSAKSFGAYYRNHVLVPPYPENTGFVELLRKMQDGKGPTQKQTT